MDNYLFKKYQEKADKQLLLIEDRKLKIRKDIYMMYFLYLNRIRSEFFNYIRKAISSIEESKIAINLTKKEMQLTTLALVNYKDIDPELWDNNEELLKELNSLIIKFQTYINGGEKNG